MICGADRERIHLNQMYRKKKKQRRPNIDRNIVPLCSLLTLELKDSVAFSTDGGGERQQWFALIREPAGGVDPEPYLFLVLRNFVEDFLSL